MGDTRPWAFDWMGQLVTPTGVLAQLPSGLAQKIATAHNAEVVAAVCSDSQAAARIAQLEADLAEAVAVIDRLRGWAPTGTTEASRAAALISRIGGQSEESE